MTSLARIVGEHDGEHSLVAIEGEIDASNTTEIGDALRGALSNRTATLVVDLTETGYLDSAGINLLFALGAELRDRQQRLHLVIAPGTPVARVIEIAGLTAAERTHDTRAEAILAARDARLADRPSTLVRFAPGGTGSSIAHRHEEPRP